MAFITQSANSASVSTSEFYLVSNSTTKTDQTNDCDLQVFLDLSAMAAGDEYRFRIYEKVNAGTQAVVHEVTFVGAASQLYASPMFRLIDAWECSLIKVSGTDRTLKWSVRYSNADSASGAQVDVTKWNGTAVATPNTAGKPLIDVDLWRGTQPNTLTSGRVEALVGAYASGQAPLQPTTAGRTLDVTATGEAGIDLANVGAPTTTLNLSGTTIAAVSGAVGSVTGAVGSVTGNVGGNVAGNVAGTVGSVTGNVGGNVVGSIGSVGAGGITANSFAADAITATKVAADVGTEIAAAVWATVIDGTRTATELLRGFTAVLFGKANGFDGATRHYRNVADSKNVVTATTDATGRTAVTLDLS